METKQYFKTHYESCVNSREHIKKCPVAKTNDKRLHISVVKSDVTNTLVRKSEFKEIDRVKEMENYRVCDFSLENLLAIGANISTVPALTGSRFTAIENIEKQITNL